MEQLPLKDIHLPEPIGWWPPAPGWWLLAVLLPLLSFAAFYLYKRLKRQTMLKTAGKMLAAIGNDKNLDRLQTLVALSALLRRVAISSAPRADVAGLSGPAWLAYLDASFQDAPFSKGVGRCLADAQYQQTVPEDADLDELLKLCERWLKRQAAAKPSPKFRTGPVRAEELAMQGIADDRTDAGGRAMQGAIAESPTIRGNK